MNWRLSFIWAIAILSLGLQACSSIEVFKENSEIPLRKNYKSFVIVNQEVNMRGFSTQFLDAKVQDRIQEVLESEGLVYDRVKPELVIRYTSNEDPRQREVNTFNNPYPFWGYRVWDPWMYNPYMYDNRPRTDNYELVQVIIDFIDSGEDKFLMTLTGVTEVSSAKTKEKKVIKATDKILERFLQESQYNQN
ncbi:DUF4136 domain-containing protein [Algoriphagus limi]|uniref:DUF4136 domain-containing protein n=1 Tax=Algoriphagus limi TaxID=2975273 RepID=A0ABT2G2V7_9BACT|nr:DUF4136 domain-containing protein [Algoriphagus limi]MCS5489570.1 DUF4136 domain-containing protein [Algoriphagus limi]